MRVWALVLALVVMFQASCTLVGLGVGALVTTTTVHTEEPPARPPTPRPTLEQLKQCMDAQATGEQVDCDPYTLTGTPRPPPYVAPPPRVETSRHPWIGLLVGLAVDAMLVTITVVSCSSTPCLGH